MGSTSGTTADGGKNEKTAAAVVRDRIRTDILEGRWAPGTRLSSGDLGRHYETSSTVVREGLTHLAGERLVSIEPNRGFFVHEISAEELTDLTELRCQIEAHAIELAIERGGLDWESELVALHHRLSRLPIRDPEAPLQPSGEWERIHREFHAQLLSACGVPAIRGFARQLSDSTEIYRKLVAASPAARSREVVREHQEIVDATVARDPVRAAAALRKHYEKTLMVVREAGARPSNDDINETPAKDAEPAEARE